MEAGWKGAQEHESYLSISTLNEYLSGPSLISPATIVAYSQRVEFQFVNEVVDKWPDCQWRSTRSQIFFLTPTLHNQEVSRPWLKNPKILFLVLSVCYNLDLKLFTYTKKDDETTIFLIQNIGYYTYTKNRIMKLFPLLDILLHVRSDC